MNNTRYELIERLGQGGFGEVWRARMYGEADFSREVAVKLLHVGADAEAGSRLRDEARLLGLFRHRCVVDVYGLTRIKGRWAIVMELVEGVSLDMFTRYGQTMPYSAALELVFDVADALHTAWTARGPEGQPLRVTHRDIKPSNLRLTTDGTLKVLDFGEARASFETRETRTRGAVVGTQRSAPPETALVSGPAADIFSLGVVLQELLTGHRWPAAPTARSAYEAQLASRLADLPEEAEPARPLLLSMLSFQARERPTAEGVMAAVALLQELATGPSLKEWAVPEVARSEAQMGSLSGWGRSVSRSVSRAASRVALLLLGLGVSAGLAVAAAMGVWEREPVSPPEPAGVVIETNNTTSINVSEELPQPDEQPIIKESPEEVVVLRSPQKTAERANVGRTTPQQIGDGLCEVRSAGDAHEIVLVGEPGRFALPASVPPGRYRVEAAFARWGKRDSDVVVIGGREAVVSCIGAFGRCGLK